MICKMCNKPIEVAKSGFQSAIYTGRILKYFHTGRMPNYYCDNVSDKHDVLKEFRYAQPMSFKEYNIKCK